ncbi:hypothetical protein [Streptomyces sp. NBC_01530]|uniref:hypothetical protein n=1 Tax=Streptomyces sp. NBC_01530 TaxID=2903895 RepID=UPI00386714DF
MARSMRTSWRRWFQRPAIWSKRLWWTFPQESLDQLRQLLADYGQQLRKATAHR